MRLNGWIGLKKERPVRNTSSPCGNHNRHRLEIRKSFARLRWPAQIGFEQIREKIYRTDCDCYEVETLDPLAGSR
jgi:hypothetical protein